MPKKTECSSNQQIERNDLSTLKLERRTMGNWLTLLDIANGSLKSPYLTEYREGIYASLYILRISSCWNFPEKGKEQSMENDSQRIERLKIERYFKEELDVKDILEEYFNIPDSKRRSERLIEILNQRFSSYSKQDQKLLVSWYKTIIGIASLNLDSSSCKNDQRRK